MKNSTENSVHIFYIQGMHCSSCVVLTETKVSDLPEVSSVKSNVNHQTITVTAQDGAGRDVLQKKIQAVLAPHGYTVVDTLVGASGVEKKNYKEFGIAALIALVFVVGFIALQKAGLDRFIDGTRLGYGTSFFIGVIASLSSCMAVVGGVVLSLSSSTALKQSTHQTVQDSVRVLQNIQTTKGTQTLQQEKESVKQAVKQSQVLFHIARIAAFFVLGGVIGALGAVFTLSTTATVILTLLIAVSMIVVGLRLLDVRASFMSAQPIMPSFFARYMFHITKNSSIVTPIAVGVLTFFLPCGFTQSMQLYTLTTKSFFVGGFTMLAFALGTLPALALISVSAARITTSRYKSIFFKTAGILVLLFAVFNAINGLVIADIIQPVFAW